MAGGVEFSPELFNTICERIAEGESLIKICQSEDMPSKTSVMRWLDNDELSAAHGLRDQYARAREALADVFAEEIVEIADDGRRDYTVDEEGRETVDHDHIARARLRVDARKWAAGKLAPKKYGDRVQQEHSGSLTITHEQAISELE